MSLVLDTNVVSELRKIRGGRADRRVRAWAERAVATDFYISVITVMEIELGVLGREKRDAVAGRALRRWFEDQVLAIFDGPLLNIDLAVARRCAALHVPDPRPERDALIAATALVHGMAVVTRNVADFSPMGVAVLDPWAV